MTKRGATTPDIQYRTVELRANQNGTGFSGYASHFWSADSYYTAVKPGAFTKTLKERSGRFPILWQHDPGKPIGKPTEIKQDKTGLYFDAAISESTSYGRDAMGLLRDDVPLGVSFGFQTVKGREANDDDPITLDQLKNDKVKKSDIYVIEEVRLWELSLVTFPANEQAVINDVRAAAEADALASLLEHIRAGTLTDEHRALVTDLVAAFTERSQPEPEPTEESTPLPDTSARHRRDNDAAAIIALAEFEGLIGVSA